MTEGSTINVWKSEKMNDENGIARNREDFIRRLFVVSLSVGFASKMANSPLIYGGEMHASDYVSLLFMLSSLIAIATSWDGYLSSTRNFPLRDVSRFYIDIFISLSYLTLLLLSNRPIAWFANLFVIFVGYSAWDLVRIMNFPEKYGIAPSDSRFISAIKLQRPFCLCISESPERAGPAITIAWTILFGLMYLIAQQSGLESPWEQVIGAIGSGTAIVIYRISKIRRLSWRLQTFFIAAIIAIFLGATQWGRFIAWTNLA